MPFPSPFTLALAKLLYPLPRPLPAPDNRTRPLKVLCLGLPRSATESLHHALLTLGYANVSHGFWWWLHRPASSMTYCELALARSSTREPPLGADELRTRFFDRTVGDCEAVTDVPTAWFAHELLAAYPDAKVILNRRRDVVAWKRSFAGSVLPMLRSWEYWFASWFQAELFWGMALTYWGHQRELFKGDFEANAEREYARHYDELEARLRREGREFLDWAVEDGWVPLCHFLDTPVPDQPFPEGNVAAEFIPKLMVVDRERIRAAYRNAANLLIAFVGCFGLLIWVVNR